MKYSNFLKCILLLSCTFIFGEELSLEQCLSLARKNNNEIKKSNFHIDYMIAAKNEIRGEFFPQINLDGRWSAKNSNWGFVSSPYDIGQVVSSQTVGVNATLGLFDFGSTRGRFSASKLYIEAGNAQKDAAVQKLEEDVKTAYFKVLEALDSLKVAQESIKTLEKQLEVSRDSFKEGLVAKSDVLTVEEQLAGEQKECLKATTALKNYRMQLNLLIGLSVLAVFDLKAIEAMPEVKVNAAEFVKVALQKRPDLKALNKQIQALNQHQKGVQRSYAPKFFAFGGYNYSHDKFFKHQDFFAGGIGVQMPLFDGGIKQAQINKIRAKKRENEIDLEDLKQTIVVDLENTFANLQELKESFELDKKTIELEEENLKVLQDRYKEGLVSINDVLAAEDKLSAAKLNQKRTFYRYHAMIAHLENISGGIKL